MTGKRHGFHAQWRVGFDDDGLLLALDATLTSDGGWSLDLSEPVLARALCHVDNAYWIPHVRVNGRIAQDEQDLADGLPRLRRPAGRCSSSRTSSAGARPLLGIDPAELRRRNFYRRRARAPPTASRCATPTGIVTCWEQVLASGDVAAPAARRSPRSTRRTSTPSARWR